ncbi:MAG: sigma-70 family RNA polymerase sigma factor [Myxococcota bacterium]
MPTRRVRPARAYLEREELRAWRAGDARAGRGLLERYARELRGYFRRRSPAHAEDLTQAVLLRCIETRDQLEDDEAFRCYIYGIAWRMLARTRRHPPVVPLSDDEQPGDHTTCPEYRYEAKRRWEALHRALRTLSSPNRRAVELYYFQGLRGAEVAAALEIPDATVRSRLFRGLNWLRRQVELDR